MSMRKRPLASHWRWIMYITNPGGLGGDLLRVESHEAAKAALREHAKNSGFGQSLTVYGTYGPTAVLYPYDTEAWVQAEELRGAGTPFDYPSFTVESGPRGGVKVTPA